VKGGQHHRNIHKCGGIGFLLTDKLSGRKISGSRGYVNTSSDRMELMAVKEALKMLQQPCEVELFSDSRYLCDSVNKGWLKLWLSDPLFSRSLRTKISQHLKSIWEH
jgi:ribonuclease HI